MHMQFLLFGVALTLLGLSLSQFAATGIGTTLASYRAARRRSRTVQSLRSEALLARMNSDLKQTQGGMPWRVLEVAETVDESEDCRSFYLVDPTGQDLPDFAPGQYVMIRPALAGAYQVTRCYSLSSAPDTQSWRITVKRQEIDKSSHHNPQNGGLSVWLHENIHAGDCLLVGGPGGHFKLDKELDSPLVLLAAGVGITPVASMLKWSLEHRPGRSVTVLYQAKDLSHWPLGQVLHSWQRKVVNCRIITYFSRETDESLADAGKQAENLRVGKLGSQTLSEFAGIDAETHYFICGPDAWMADMRESLSRLGVDSERVHWESFGGMTEPTAPAQENASFETFQVQFARSQTAGVWSDRQQSLWEFGRENNVEIPSGCLSGVCGSCRVKLLSGKVAYDAQPMVELEENECLSCVSQPASDLVIDA